MGARIWIILTVVGLVVSGCGRDDRVADPTETTLGAEASPATVAEPDGGAVAQGASAGGGSTTGSLLLLSDDFQDGDASDWDVHYGWFTYGSGGQYALAASGAAWAWWDGGASWEAHYVLRVSVRIDRGGLAVCVAVGPEGRYVVHLNETSTDLLLDRPWGTLQAIASGPPIEVGVWHALAVGLDGGQVQVYADGVPLLEHVVSAPLQAGSVGFGALADSVVAFDNVLVNVLQASLPAARFPQAAPPSAIEPGLVIVDALEGGTGDAGSLPDLVFSGVEFDQSRYAPGDPITVTILVHNAAAQSVGPFSVAWEAGDGGCTAEVLTIAAGETVGAQCTSAGLATEVEVWSAFVDDDERVAERDEANNVGWGSIAVEGADVRLPNLVPDFSWFWHHASDRGISIHSPTADLPFGIGIVVKDLNGFTGDIGTYTVRFILDGSVACSVDQTGVGSEAEPTFCDYPGLARGTHVLEAIIDAEGDIPETREDDNRYSHEFVVDLVAEPEGVDLHVDQVVVDPVQPRAGEEFDVTVWVTATPFTGDELPDYTIRWRLQDGPIACEWGSTLRSGGYPCVWRFDQAGTYRWRARVDVTGAVAETDETNNELRGSITVVP